MDVWSRQNKRSELIGDLMFLLSRAATLALGRLGALVTLICTLLTFQVIGGEPGGNEDRLMVPEELSGGDIVEIHPVGRYMLAKYQTGSSNVLYQGAQYVNPMRCALTVFSCISVITKG